MVESNQVTTLVADWSDDDEEISVLLEALGSKQLPVIAVFPAGDPYHPEVLTGLYTQRQLIEKIRAAGKSKRSEKYVSKLSEERELTSK